MGQLDLKVKTLKGAVVDNLVAQDTDTLLHLKHLISSKLPGVDVASMKLMHKAKFLATDGATLMALGIQSSSELQLAARFEGGVGGGAAQVIAKQLLDVQRAGSSGLVAIEPEDEFTWNLIMEGPRSSPYKAAMLSITVHFPRNYPQEPPTIYFNQEMFHPNIYSSGRLCWKDNDNSGSCYTADVLIGAINMLLQQPNTGSPANSDATRLFTSDKAEYERKAKTLARDYIPQL